MKLPKELVEEATSKFADFTVNQVTVFGENMERSERLIMLYNALVQSEHVKGSVHSTDILRAAVVFMHAALEELIRSLIVAACASAPKAEIDKVPLFSPKRSRQAEKFLLGALIEYKHLTIEDLIQKSIEQHFRNQTFNNRADLMRAMEIIGANKKLADKMLPTLDSMLDRRHQIVHRVDRPKIEDDQWIRATSLSPRHVEKWAKTVREFGVFLVTSAGVNKHLAPLTNVKR